MLYKFKSKVTGDLIMLEPNARKILTVIGKDPAALGKGILLPADMPAALAALDAAIAEEDASQRQRAEVARTQGEDPPHNDGAVSLRQRALPFMDMLRRCHQADQEIVWGV
ncbi:MAG: DUF1840 domain-containing protein [Rhodoferax sp.]